MPRPVELDSAEFAAMMSGIIADLGLRESEHPWSTVPSLPSFIEPANGVLVRGVATVYFVQNDLESAKAELADRLQDHVIDITWHAIPACIAGILIRCGLLWWLVGESGPVPVPAQLCGR